jgi:hypothetical protein
LGRDGPAARPSDALRPGINAVAAITLNHFSRLFMITRSA